MRDSIAFLSRVTTDVPVRGAFELRSGETAIVLDGGRVLVCKAPRLLSEHASIALRTEWQATHFNEACGFAAIDNQDGPTREQQLIQRREQTQCNRDRKVVATIVDIPDFTEGAMGSGMTDVQRKARTESIAREVPDV